jgi:hypothetical protein
MYSFHVQDIYIKFEIDINNDKLLKTKWEN